MKAIYIVTLRLISTSFDCFVMCWCEQDKTSEWVNEWSVFNTYWALSHLYHGYNMHITFQLDDDIEEFFILDEHSRLECSTASSQKQQYTGRDVTLIGQIIPIPSRPFLTPSLYWSAYSKPGKWVEFCVLHFIVMVWREHEKRSNYKKVGAWCLAPFSTTFRLYRGSVEKRNYSIQRDGGIQTKEALKVQFFFQNQ